MSDSSDEEHKGPVGHLKELLKDTTFVMEGQDRKWTKRYKWVKFATEFWFSKTTFFVRTKCKEWNQ